MKHEQKSVVMDGDTAAAYISHAFTEVASIFPITPSSTIAEKVDAWAANGKKNSPWRYTGNPCRAAQRAGGKGHCHLQMRRLHRRRSGGGNRGHHHHARKASFSPGFPGLSIFKSGPLSEYSGPLFCFLQGKFTQHPPGAAAPGSWRHLPLSRWAWGKCRCCWRPRRAACRLL